MGVDFRLFLREYVSNYTIFDQSIIILKKLRLMIRNFASQSLEKLIDIRFDAEFNYTKNKLYDFIKLNF